MPFSHPTNLTTVLQYQIIPSPYSNFPNCPQNTFHSWFIQIGIQWKDLSYHSIVRIFPLLLFFNLEVFFLSFPPMTLTSGKEGKCLFAPLGALRCHCDVLWRLSVPGGQGCLLMGFTAVSQATRMVSGTQNVRNRWRVWPQERARGMWERGERLRLLSEQRVWYKAEEGWWHGGRGCLPPPQLIGNPAWPCSTRKRVDTRGTRPRLASFPCVWLSSP